MTTCPECDQPIVRCWECGQPMWLDDVVWVCPCGSSRLWRPGDTPTTAERVAADGHRRLFAAMNRTGEGGWRL